MGRFSSCCDRALRSFPVHTEKAQAQTAAETAVPQSGEKCSLLTTHATCTTNSWTGIFIVYGQSNLKLRLGEVMEKLLLAKSPCSAPHKQRSIHRLLKRVPQAAFPGTTTAFGSPGACHQVPAVSPLQPPACKADFLQELISIKRPRAFSILLPQFWVEPGRGST